MIIEEIFDCFGQRGRRDGRCVVTDGDVHGSDDESGDIGARWGGMRRGGVVGAGADALEFDAVDESKWRLGRG